MLISHVDSDSILCAHQSAWWSQVFPDRLSSHFHESWRIVQTMRCPANAVYASRGSTITITALDSWECSSVTFPDANRAPGLIGAASQAQSKAGKDSDIHTDQVVLM